MWSGSVRLDDPTEPRTMWRSCVGCERQSPKGSICTSASSATRCSTVGSSRLGHGGAARTVTSGHPAWPSGLPSTSARSSPPGWADWPINWRSGRRDTVLVADNAELATAMAAAVGSTVSRTTNLLAGVAHGAARGRSSRIGGTHRGCRRRSGCQGHHHPRRTDRGPPAPRARGPVGGIAPSAPRYGGSGPLVRPAPVSARPGVSMVKKLIRRLVAWEIDPVGRAAQPSPTGHHRSRGRPDRVAGRRHPDHRSGGPVTDRIDPAELIEPPDPSDPTRRSHPTPLDVDEAEAPMISQKTTTA